MNFKLRYNFWKIQQQAGPSADFRRELWSKLEQRLSAGDLSISIWYKSAWFRYALAAAVFILVFGGGTLGAYAYESPEVTEGTALYPVKRAIEGVEERLRRTPEARASFYLKQLRRREAERVVLERRQKQAKNTETQIERVEQQLEKIEAKLTTSTVRSIRLRQAVEKKLEQRRARLNQKIDLLKAREERLGNTPLRSNCVGQGCR